MARPKKQKTESIVRDIKRKTRKKYTAEEKIGIVLEGLRGEESDLSHLLKNAFFYIEITIVEKHKCLIPNKYLNLINSIYL